jgi:hypothetical protein
MKWTPKSGQENKREFLGTAKIAYSLIQEDKDVQEATTEVDPKIWTGE